MPNKDVLYLEFFKRLKESIDIVISVKRLCLFNVLNGSHDVYAITCACITYTKKDLRIVE
jgi:hypothetical protein